MTRINTSARPGGLSLFQPLALALCLTLALPHSARAERRVYQGSEAEALKCAYLFSHSAVVMEKGGYIPAKDRDVLIAVSGLILQRYVGGTEAQKLRALRAVGSRRNTVSTLLQFRDESRYCFKRFPIRAQ